MKAISLTAAINQKADEGDAPQGGTTGGESLITELDRHEKKGAVKDRSLTALALAHRHRGDGGAAAALDFQRLHDECELGDLLGCHLVKFQIFKQVHPVDHQ